MRIPGGHSDPSTGPQASAFEPPGRQPGGLRDLVLELSLAHGGRTNLARMLEQLLAGLRRLPDLPLRPAGAVLLYNTVGRPVPVAAIGVPAGIDWEPLQERRASARPETAFLPGPGLARLPCWVLPLWDGSRQLGHAVLFPNRRAPFPAAHAAGLTDLSRALSVLVARRMLDEIVLVREWELAESRTEAIHRLGIASEYRDNETGWHVMRMANFALAIARRMPLAEERRELLYVTAPMHDVGKIGVPDNILLKPGRLTDEETRIMQRHTEIGEKILKGDDAFMIAAREIAGSHHERWDGTGYPRGLAGEAIPLLARICAVADVFDALVSPRPYKQAWPVEDAAAWIVGQAGRHFDPAVVEGFVGAIPEILGICRLYRDDLIDPSLALKLPEAVALRDRWMVWEDRFSVGIELIDAQHRHLFDLLNEMHLVVADHQGAPAVARLLKALDVYAQVHFRAEEHLLETYGVQDAPRHRRSHQWFRDRLRALQAELHVSPLTAPYDLLDFASSWLARHVLGEDAALRELAGQYPDRQLIAG